MCKSHSAVSVLFKDKIAKALDNSTLLPVVLVLDACSQYCETSFNPLLTSASQPASNSATSLAQSELYSHSFLTEAPATQ